MLLSGIERQVFVTKVLDDISLMVWVKDRNNNLIFLNKHASNKLFDCDSVSDITKEKCPLSCQAQKVCTQEEQVIEQIKIRGEDVWLNCKKIPINESGGMVVFAEDITDRIKKENVILEKLNTKIEGWKSKRKLSIEKSNEEMEDIHRVLNEIKKKRIKK